MQLEIVHPYLLHCLFEKRKVLCTSTGKGGVVKQLEPIGLISGHFHSVRKRITLLVLNWNTWIPFHVEVIDYVHIIKGNNHCAVI